VAGDLHALLLTSPPAAPATVPLTGGLFLLPLVDSSVASTGDDSVVDGFYELTNGVAEWARRQSVHGDVAYLHSEFFGGHGFHAAVAWRDGAIALGPLFTETSAGEAEDHYTVPTEHHDMAGNVVLRWLGVRRTGHADEFAAAGLDRFRSTAEWAALTT